MWVLSQNGSEMERFFFFNIPCDSVAFNRVELGSNLISEASEP